MIKNTIQVIFFLLLLPLFNEILACSTCYGAPDAPATEGLNGAIISLLGTTGSVLAGIGVSIFSIRKKTKAFHNKTKKGL
tara:strand:+ start:164 stop:403 length:240 start_codon:yes stop_codon:yes gene_type:complete